MEEIIQEDCLSICAMGNLRGIKQARMEKDFAACEGYAGAKKIKKAISLNWAHLEFEDSDQKAKTLRAIQGLVFKNKPLTFNIKREQGYDIKKPRLDAEDIEVRDVVTPLWKMSYDEQLAHKGRLVYQTLFQITKRTLEDSKHAIPDWIKQM